MCFSKIFNLIIDVLGNDLALWADDNDEPCEPENDFFTDISLPPLEYRQNIFDSDSNLIGIEDLPRGDSDDDSYPTDMMPRISDDDESFMSAFDHEPTNIAGLDPDYPSDHFLFLFA